MSHKELDLPNLAIEACRRALGLEEHHAVVVSKTDAGMNNWVYEANIYMDGKEQNFIVRLYNNGDNYQQVLYEHQILILLRN